jgi:hypothetical protein
MEETLKLILQWAEMIELELAGLRCRELELAIEAGPEATKAIDDRGKVLAEVRAKLEPV